VPNNLKVSEVLDKALELLISSRKRTEICTRRRKASFRRRCQLAVTGSDLQI
jgi:hypothetical protein